MLQKLRGVLRVSSKAFKVLEWAEEETRGLMGVKGITRDGIYDGLDSPRESSPCEGGQHCQEETTEVGEMDGFSRCRGMGGAQA